MQIRITTKFFIELIDVKDGIIISSSVERKDLLGKRIEDVSWYYINRNELISWEVL